LELFSGEEVQWLECPPQFATQAGREAARSKFYKWLRKGAKPYVPPASPAFPSTIRDLVCACMSPKPEERPTFAAIVKLLNGVDLSPHVATAVTQLSVPETTDDTEHADPSPAVVPVLPVHSSPSVPTVSTRLLPQQRLSPTPRHRKPIRRSPTPLRKVSVSPPTLTECSVIDELPHTPVSFSSESVSLTPVDANPSPLKLMFQSLSDKRERHAPVL
jgi:serine/threonine protein kinase